MKRLALGVAAGMAVLLAAGAVRAQPLPGPLFGPQAYSTRASTGLLGQMVRAGWVQVAISCGRIVATGGAMGPINNTLRNGAFEERLSITPSESGPAIQYELTTPTERRSLDISSGSVVHLLRAPRGKSDVVPAEFRQTVYGGITFRVAPLSGSRQYTAASLWHFWLAEPEACQQYLAPLVEMLGHDWRLKDRAAAVEAELLQIAAAGQSPDRRSWTELLAQLADDRFAKREAADRELRAAGPAVLPFLEQVDFPHLEPEQQARVRQIVAALRRDMEEDPPEQVAAWLAGDPAVWVSLLNRPQESTRRAALDQLKRLLGAAIVFDPAAAQEVRQRQWEQVRSRVLAH